MQSIFFIHVSVYQRNLQGGSWFIPVPSKSNPLTTTKLNRTNNWTQIFLSTFADASVEMRVAGCSIVLTKLFIFSTESWWYSFPAWDCKSVLASFQFLYGWLINCFALEPWWAGIGKSTQATQKKPSVRKG